MKPKPASSPFRRFLRGLTNTCLLLLLPVQLTLCWVANLDHPTKLPDFLTERITTQLTETRGRKHLAMHVVIFGEYVGRGNHLT